MTEGSGVAAGEQSWGAAVGGGWVAVVGARMKGSSVSNDLISLA